MTVLLLVFCCKEETVYFITVRTLNLLPLLPTQVRGGMASILVRFAWMDEVPDPALGSSILHGWMIRTRHLCAQVSAVSVQ